MEFGQSEAHLQLIAEIATKHRADHDRRALAIEWPVKVASGLQRLRRRIQQQKLQRIPLSDLLGRHFVFAPIVLVSVEKAAKDGAIRAAVELSPGMAGGVRPATFGRFAPRVSARFHQFPERGDGERVRQNRAHTHNRDRFEIRWRARCDIRSDRGDPWEVPPAVRRAVFLEDNMRVEAADPE